MSADGETPHGILPPKMGRPPKLVENDDLIKQIEGLARIQCTQREAAAVLRVHRDTFADFLGSSNKAMEAWDNGQEQGKASLRRLQYKNAESGNSTMQIWLGKQWIGQRDQNETTLSAGGDLATLLAKVATQSVFPKDDSTSASNTDVKDDEQH